MKKMETKEKNRNSMKNFNLIFYNNEKSFKKKNIYLNNLKNNNLIYIFIY
jgi:hypothetical protein